MAEPPDWARAGVRRVHSNRDAGEDNAKHAVSQLIRPRARRFGRRISNGMQLRSLCLNLQPTSTFVR